MIPINTQPLKRLAKALLIISLLTLVALTTTAQAATTDAQKTEFKPISPQFIAALGDPNANQGTTAHTWGHWNFDPGRTGVWLSLFPVLKAAGGYAPGNWQFDSQDWWLDENGLLMTKPTFPIAPGRYLVTGEREITTGLTIYPPENNGSQRWKLDDNTKLHQVTHLPCRTARYTPPNPITDTTPNTCTPEAVDKTVFKISPGGELPAVQGCHKQDYQVLIIVGLPKE